eukprot:PhM_4_TR12355/c0_g1_i1/m.17107
MASRVAVINSCLRLLKMRSFLAYLNQIRDSQWERKCWELQKLVDNCPVCAIRPVEHERTQRRLTEAYNLLEDTQKATHENNALLLEERRRVAALESELSRARDEVRHKEDERAMLEVTNQELRQLHDAMLVQVDALKEKENLQNSELRFLEDELSNTRLLLDNSERSVKNLAPRPEGLSSYFVHEASRGHDRVHDITEDARLRRKYDSTHAEPFARRRTGTAQSNAEGGNSSPQPGNRLGPFVESIYRPAVLSSDAVPPPDHDPYHAMPPQPNFDDVDETGETSVSAHTKKEAQANEVCPKCRLRMNLAPFCAKDGQRHTHSKTSDPVPEQRRSMFQNSFFAVPPAMSSYHHVAATAPQQPFSQAERRAFPLMGPHEAQELSAYIRDTRIAAMKRQQTEGGARPSSVSATNTPSARTQPWSNVFQTSDINSGSFGLPTKLADPLFGVYSADQSLGEMLATSRDVPNAVPSTTLQKGTPSFRQR